MFNHTIIDVELARSFYNTDKAQGHMEMTGFWELIAQYRELTNQKGAFRISEKELGIMRDLNPENPSDSAVMKLARKRFLEFTSSTKHHRSNLSRKLTRSEVLYFLSKFYYFRNNSHYP